jgi:hypothetical protein
LRFKIHWTSGGHIIYAKYFPLQPTPPATFQSPCPEMLNSHSCSTPSKQHSTVRRGIRIRSAQFAYLFSNISAGYVSEVHNSHICLAASDAEYVSEVRNSHSCAMPSKQISRIGFGIRIRNAIRIAVGALSSKCARPGLNPGPSGRETRS